MRSNVSLSEKANNVLNDVSRAFFHFFIFAGTATGRQGALYTKSRMSKDAPKESISKDAGSYVQI